MRINFAHLSSPSTTGRNVSFAIFEAKANNDSLRDTFLNQLTNLARQNDLRVESAALVYSENGQMKYWGDEFAVSYLKARGIPAMTNYMEI